MNSVLYTDLEQPLHFRRLAGLREFFSTASEEFLNPLRHGHNQHDRGLIADVLERVNQPTRHERSSARADFVPVVVRKKSHATTDDIKQFLLVHVIMRGRPATRRRDFRPHC